MPKAGPMPIEFNAKLYFIVGTLAGLLAVTSIFFAIHSKTIIGAFPAVTFAIASFVSFRVACDAPR